MDVKVKFYSLSALPAAVAGAAGSFVNVTAGADAGMWYCTGTDFLRLDNVAQDKSGEINAASVDTATGVVSFKNGETVKFTVSLADYIAAEVAKLTGSATIASVAGGVVTLKAGVSEADGKISNSAADDIVLAKAATTGSAVDIVMSDVSYPDGWKWPHEGGAIINQGDTVQTILAAQTLALEDHIHSNVEAFASVDANISATYNSLRTEISNTSVGIKGYVDTQDAATLDSAKAYADGQDAVTLASAKVYTDAATIALIGEDSDSESYMTLWGVKNYVDYVKANEGRDIRNEIKAYVDAQDATTLASAQAAIATEVANIVAGADSDFDTLKEVADWIKSDTTGAAKLQIDVDALKTSVSTAETKISALEADTHTHANKAELDKIVLGDKDNWDAAYAVMHSHTNKGVLDGITAEKVASWDGAVSAAGVTSVGGKAGAITLEGSGVAAGSVNLSIDDSGKISAVLVGSFVETEVGKGLSTNDLTDDLKAGYDTAVSKAHEHNNFAVLQQITSASLETWGNAVSDINNHMIDLDPHVTPADKSKWNAAEQNAKDYADTQDATTLASAKDYTDAALTWLSEFPVA